MFYRLIKPNWGKKTLQNGEPNKDFKQLINGPDIIEGCFSPEEVSVLNQAGYNAYWFPNHPSSDVYASGTKFLSGKLINVFNFVFVDMDLKDEVYKSVDEFYDRLSQFSLPPTMVVSSGHGVHAYWEIKNLSRESYISTQMALIKYFQTDESIWTVLQLMRVPESLNTKEFDNFKVASVQNNLSSGNSYNIEDFPSEIYDLLGKSEIAKIDTHLARLDGKIELKLDPNTNIDELPSSFLDLVFENESIFQLFNNPKAFYGDRSGADMKLANILRKNNISKQDALAVIANTEKAREKGASRFQYAEITVSKAYANYKEDPIIEKPKLKFQSVKQRLDNGFADTPKEYVKGPYYFDSLVNGWAKTQVLGLVGGSGVGKSAVTLETFKHMIENNTDNDDIFAFFSLEMPEREIVDRWVSLVGADSPLADRLYVISNETEEGDPRNIGLQEIYEYCLELKALTGKELGAIAIDHFGILSLHIDTRKKYTFGIDAEQGAGNGQIKIMSLKNAANQIKALAKMLNTFVILLSQTTKAKGQGHTPLGKDAAYGVSQFEQIVDYLITIWQPLQLIQEQTELRLLAWQYAKIRAQHRDDVIKINSYKLLSYNMDTGALTSPTEAEYREFIELMPIVLEEQRKKEKQIETTYSRSISKEMLDLVAHKLKRK